jgi:pimeloyl-ACP methyl ester carboxylesterase
MPVVTVRHDSKAGADIDIYYEAVGDPTHPPILLVMGINAPHLVWPRAVVAGIAARGFYAITWDNRDVGQSSHLDKLGEQSICCLVCCPNCCAPPPSYTLADMAADAVALADKLGLKRFHVCGQSMGGMIAQHIINQVPDRVITLSLMFTSPGSTDLPEPTLSVKLALGSKPRDGSRDAFIDNFGEMSKTCFLGPNQLDEGVPAQRALAGALYDYSTYDKGALRQASAIVRQVPRDAICAAIDTNKTPVLVFHGKLDKLVLPEHGARLHQLIKGSTMFWFENLAHAVLPSHHAQLIDVIASHAESRNEPLAAGVAPVTTQVSL